MLKSAGIKKLSSLLDSGSKRLFCKTNQFHPRNVIFFFSSTSHSPDQSLNVHEIAQKISFQNKFFSGEHEEIMKNVERISSFISGIKKSETSVIQSQSCIMLYESFLYMHRVIESINKTRKKEDKFHKKMSDFQKEVNNVKQNLLGHIVSLKVHVNSSAFFLVIHKLADDQSTIDFFKQLFQRLEPKANISIQQLVMFGQASVLKLDSKDLNYLNYLEERLMPYLLTNEERRTQKKRGEASGSRSSDPINEKHFLFLYQILLKAGSKNSSLLQKLLQEITLRLDSFDVDALSLIIYCNNVASHPLDNASCRNFHEFKERVEGILFQKDLTGMNTLYLIRALADILKYDNPRYSLLIKLLESLIKKNSIDFGESSDQISKIGWILYKASTLIKTKISDNDKKALNSCLNQLGKAFISHLLNKNEDFFFQTRKNISLSHLTLGLHSMEEYFRENEDAKALNSLKIFWKFLERALLKKTSFIDKKNFLVIINGFGKGRKGGPELWKAFEALLLKFYDEIGIDEIHELVPYIHKNMGEKSLIKISHTVLKLMKSNPPINEAYLKSFIFLLSKRYNKGDEKFWTEFKFYFGKYKGSFSSYFTCKILAYSTQVKNIEDEFFVDYIEIFLEKLKINFKPDDLVVFGNLVVALSERRAAPIINLSLLLDKTKPSILNAIETAFINFENLTGKHSVSFLFIKLKLSSNLNENDFYNLRSLMDLILKKTGELSVDSLAQLIWCAIRMKEISRNIQMASLEKKGEKSTFEVPNELLQTITKVHYLLKPHHISMIALNLSLIQEGSEAIWKKLASSCLSLLSEMSPQEIVNSFSGLAKSPFYDLLDEDIWDEYFLEFQKHLQNFNEIDYNQLLSSLKHLSKLERRNRVHYDLLKCMLEKGKPV